MAISPTSLSNSASFLQDVRNTQANNLNQANAVNRKQFNNIVENQVGDKKTSVAAEVKAAQAEKSSLKVDIKIGEDEKTDNRKYDLSLSTQREAPLGGQAQNQPPGSVVDIRV